MRAVLGCCCSLSTGRFGFLTWVHGRDGKREEFNYAPKCNSVAYLM
ncbi:hypothetical protein CAter10_4512 [Collimonas arenae]|nr:hypothetical protein CAter10_4512 [Collimonas arenae]